MCYLRFPLLGVIVMPSMPFFRTLAGEVGLYLPLGRTANQSIAPLRSGQSATDSPSPSHFFYSERISGEVDPLPLKQAKANIIMHGSRIC